MCIMNFNSLCYRMCMHAACKYSTGVNMERGKNDARYSDYNRLDITSRIYELIFLFLTEGLKKTTPDLQHH
jgi:hypothetical protein